MKIKKPFFLLLTISLTLLVLLLTRRFIILLLTCLFLSYLIRPIYKLLNSFINNKTASALISELLFFSLIIFIIIFSINSLLSQLVAISSPLLAENLIDLESMTFFTIDLKSIDFENPLTKETINSVVNNIKSVITRAPIIIIEVFLIIFITFYLIKGSNNIYNTIIRVLPSNSKDSVERFIKKIESLTKEILYGYFLTAIFIALLTFILLKLLGVQYSVDYAIFSGLASLIPVIGNWIVPLFLAFYFGFNNKIFISISLLLFAVATSYLIKMFRLIISKNKYNIHPILFIIGVVSGFYSIGFLGFLIGPILFGVVQNGFEEFLKKS